MKDGNLINALGGLTQVSEMTGANLSTICNWRHRGIPIRYRMLLGGVARRRNIKLPKGFYDPLADFLVVELP